MSFRSLYRHGFARVAACTTAAPSPTRRPTRCRDPATGAGVHDQAVAVAVFPELVLSGYAIDDLLLQDALLDAVERRSAALIARIGGAAAAAAGRRAAAPARPALQHARSPIHRGRLLGRRAEDPSAQLPRVLRAAAFASGERHRRAARSASAGQTAPFGTDLLFAAEDLPGFVVHAEICEDFWVPVPPALEAALAGATVLANLSASNITIGKAETRRLLCRSQSARCLAAYLYSAAGHGRVHHRPRLGRPGRRSSRTATCSPRPSASRPPTSWRSPTSISTCCGRSARGRARSTTTAAGAAAARRASAAVAFRLDPPDGRYRAAAAGRALPVRARRSRAAGAGLLRGLQHPGRRAWCSGCAATGIERIVIGVSGGLDSTHALIVAAQAMRPARPAAHQHPRLHHARLRHQRGDQGQRLAADAGARRDRARRSTSARPRGRCSATSSHPFARGEPVYDVTFENVQAGLRTDYLFRLANQHGGFVLGTGDLSELALGWCTYGVGDQMCHYNVNAGVPKTLIQHLIRWVIGSGQFDADVDDMLEAILEHRDLARAGAGRGRARRRRAPRRRSAPTSCRTSTCSTRCATASGRRRSPSWRCTPGATSTSGAWPPGFPAGAPARLRPRRRSGNGWRCSCSASSASASSSARRCRTARRSRPAARCRRAATGARRRTATPRVWLEELERNVPES